MWEGGARYEGRKLDGLHGLCRKGLGARIDSGLIFRTGSSRTSDIFVSQYTDYTGEIARTCN